MSPSNLAIQLPLSIDWQQEYLEELIRSGSVLPIPQSVVDRDGKEMDTSGDRWVFNLGPSTHSRTWKVESPLLRHSLMSFAINRIMRISASAGNKVVADIPSMLSQSPIYSKLSTAPDLETFRETLVQVMIELADVLKRDQTYWRYWFPVAWYKWGATRSADLGFDRSFGQRLETLKIPGGVKGAAVRCGDPRVGPLDPELERPLLELALDTDFSSKRSHLQQRLAMALTLIFGRNPLSFRLLTEEDFRTGTDDTGKRVHTLAIPLIKKRRPPRSEFQTVEIGSILADLITQVIEANSHIEPMAHVMNADGSSEAITMHRTLFMARNPRPAVLNSSDRHYALSISGGDFSGLLQSFVRRHGIVSPITSESMHITPRRMRYTFATDMVDMGLSRAELAIALGHGDTQSVRFYFDIGSRIVHHLEKAVEGRIEPVLEMFMPSADSCIAPPGASMSLPQRLVPPGSCFLCPLFRPRDDARLDDFLEVLRKDIDSAKPVPHLLLSEMRRVALTIDRLMAAYDKGGEADE